MLLDIQFVHPTHGEVAVAEGFAVDRARPFGGVDQHLLHVGLMVDREGFVAGLEVEDTAVAALEAATAAENFAAGEPADENEFVGFGDDGEMGPCVRRASSL